MSFYDFYFDAKNDITKIGKKIVQFQNRYFISLIKKHLNKKNITLLEIGPGKGFFASECLKRNINYVCIEANAKTVLRLRKKGIKVYKGKVPPITISGKFDVIFMDQVFEHMESIKPATELVKECRKHLNTNGLLIISSPDATVWEWDFFNGDYTHNFVTTLNRTKQLLLDQNFLIVNSGYYSLIFRGNFLTKLLSRLTQIIYNLGLLFFVPHPKALKIKHSINRSFYLVGEK
jgi:2-polyprenyl-3-methyl-5-hydroxy-6-metoxy-1,4-benzoquinol methylase